MNTEPSPFEITIPVEPADIDELGHVNNVAYLRWVQDVTVAHWRAIAAVEDRPCSGGWWCATRSTTNTRPIWATGSSPERGSGPPAGERNERGGAQSGRAVV